MKVTMNRTHKHSYFPEKNTTLYHQALILFYHISLYVQEELQSGNFMTHKKMDSKNLALDT